MGCLFILEVTDEINYFLNTILFVFTDCTVRIKTTENKIFTQKIWESVFYRKNTNPFIASPTIILGLWGKEQEQCRDCLIGSLNKKPAISFVPLMYPNMTSHFETLCRKMNSSLQALNKYLHYIIKSLVKPYSTHDTETRTCLQTQHLYFPKPSASLPAQMCAEVRATLLSQNNSWQ